MKFAVNASIMFIFSKKKLARGEKEINQLSVLLKFVCCRFAFGFSGPPLFGDKNHTGFLDFPTDFPFFSHGLSRKAERGVERTASGEEEKLHPTGKKKAIPPHRRKKGALILLIKARPLQTKAEKGHELERKSSRSLKPKSQKGTRLKRGPKGCPSRAS